MAECGTHFLDLGIDVSMDARDKVENLRIAEAVLAVLSGKCDAVEGNHRKAIVQVHLRGRDPLRLVVPSAMHMSHRTQSRFDLGDIVRLESLLAHDVAKRIEGGMDARYRCVRFVTDRERFPARAE